MVNPYDGGAQVALTDCPIAKPHDDGIVIASPGGPMAKPSGDGAVIAAAMGITDSEDGIEVPTNASPTGVPIPNNGNNITTLCKQMLNNRLAESI
jgi:hypothetical protein